MPQKYFGNNPHTPSVIADGFKKEKDDNTYRIFALGGSTTAGYPHPPNGSFPRILKNKLLVEYPHINFEVINLGVSAINSVTIRDIIDDVLNESPNLIIIYTGHNEYYGAMGAVSKLNWFNNETVSRLLLQLREFRIVQLLENSVKSFLSIFASSNEKNETLMSRMAGDNLVPLNSELFQIGVEQYETNLDYILSRCKEENIITIIGTLSSNLQQQPLCGYSGCDSLLERFESTILTDNDNYEELLEIRELDQLRFRAPNIFNQIILNKSQKFNHEIIDINEIFEDKSPNGIVGNNLMLDHLHPNLFGNSIIADSLLFLIRDNNDLMILSKKYQDTPFQLRYSKNITYTKLDSSFSASRVRHLKSNFPFVAEKNNSTLTLPSESIEDSISNNIIYGKISWENAHLRMADIFLQQKEYEKYLNEINVLIEDKPFDKYPYLSAIKEFRNAKKVNFLLYVLHKYFRVFPDTFASKTLGDIYFNMNENNKSIHFYQEFLKLSTQDPGVYFNLSSLYFKIKDIEKSLNYILKCLELDPNYPNAKRIFDGLSKMKKKK